MHAIKKWGIVTSGICAGFVNGLFGAGGGMILVPLLTKFTNLTDNEIFPTSVSIILPICLVSLIFSQTNGNVNLEILYPCLLGSTAGGIVAGYFGRKIPTNWLHKGLGLLILWGGIRYLC